MWLCLATRLSGSSMMPSFYISSSSIFTLPRVLFCSKKFFLFVAIMPASVSKFASLLRSRDYELKSIRPYIWFESISPSLKVFSRFNTVFLVGWIIFMPDVTPARLLRPYSVLKLSLIELKLFAGWNSPKDVAFLAISYQWFDRSVLFT